MPLIINKFPPDRSLEYLDMDDPEDELWFKAAQEILAKKADHQKIPPSVLASRKSQERPIARKGIVTTKGGAGSGDFGHAGRPGEVGGSSGKGNKLFPDGAVVNTEDAVLAVLKKINSNPEMHRYIVAVECDSGVSAGDDLGYIPIPGLEAVTWEGPEGNMGEYEVRNKAVYTEISDEITKISEDCEKAYAQGTGWWDPDDDASTKERQEWEKRMYGKVIGGHNKSYAYGSDMVKNYVKSILGDIKVIKPKKAKKKLTDPRDIFYNKYVLGKKVKQGDSVWEVVSHMGWGKSDEHAVVMRNSGRERVVTISGTVFDVPTGKHYWDYKPRPKANKEKIVVTKGGPGSGHEGHAGRPGKHGGSLPGKGGAYLFTAEEMDLFDRNRFDKWPVENHLLIRYNIDEVANQPEEIKDYVVTELSQVSGLGYQDVNKLVAGWARTSNDADLQAMNLQDAAAKLRGVELSEWQQEKKELLDGVRPIVKKWSDAEEDYMEGRRTMDDRLQDDALKRKHKAETELADYRDAAYRKYPDETDVMNLDLRPNRWIEEFEKESWQKPQMDAFVKAVYTRTQNWLKASGYEPNDTITLYRGIWWDGPIGSKNVGYEGNAIESWSLSHRPARNFGNVLLATRVKVKDIFSVPLVGIGCPREEEVVIFGDSIDYVVARPRGGL